MAKRPEIALDEIKIGKRHRVELGNTTDLMVSMDRIGLLHPVVLDKEHNLVSGWRRLQVAKILEWNTIPYVVAESVVDALTHLLAERDENSCRLDFSPSEKVAMGKALEEIEKPKADKRKAEGQKTGGKVRTGSLMENLHQAGEGSVRGKGATREIVASALGVSGPTYDRMKLVVEAAEEDPETFGEIAAEMDRTGKAFGAAAKVKAIKNGEAVAETDDKPEEVKLRGVGVIRATEAVACLKKIPKNDALRKRGFQIVADFIKQNK